MRAKEIRMPSSYLRVQIPVHWLSLPFPSTMNAFHERNQRYAADGKYELTI